MRKDPYLLLSTFPTLHFRAVDGLARTRLDVRTDAPNRAVAAIHFCLRKSTKNGNCAVPRARLRDAAAHHLVLLPSGGGASGASGGASGASGGVGGGALSAAAAVREVERALLAERLSGALVEETPPVLAGTFPARGPREIMISTAGMHQAERHATAPAQPKTVASRACAVL